MSELNKRTHLWKQRVVALLLLALVITLGIAFRDQISLVFRDPEGLRHWVKSFGNLAPLVFVGLQFIQVVVFIIPGEVVQIAGGYLFGVVPGLVYSLIGILAGSVFNFLLARLLGKAFIGSLMGHKTLLKMKHFIDSPKAVIGFFLFFLIPGIPKDVLCYAAGLSSMRLVIFLMISLLGRLPALLGSVIIGDAAGDQQWVLAGILAGVALILFVIGLIHREKIHTLVERMIRKTGQ